MRLATVLAWACVSGALAASVAWVVTGDWLLAAFTVALGLVTCWAMLRVDDELADTAPHPLDPHTEELRRRMALGRLQDRAPRRRASDEDGW